MHEAGKELHTCTRWRIYSAPNGLVPAAGADRAVPDRQGADHQALSVATDDRMLNQN